MGTEDVYSCRKFNRLSDVSSPVLIGSSSMRTQSVGLPFSNPKINVLNI